MFSNKLQWFKNVSKRIFKPRNNRTYIIPSKQGGKFIVLMVLLLLIGMVYNNNLVLGLCFLLVSWFIIVMHLSHENIRTLKVEKSHFNFGFSHQDAELEITLSSSKWIDGRYDIEVNAYGFLKKFSFTSGNTHTFRLQTKNLELTRGLHSDVRIKVSSEFPFGLFRPWKRFRVDHPWVVAPTKKMAVGSQRSWQSEDYREFASFQLEKERKPGQVVDWKMTSAREEIDNQYIVRDFQAPVAPQGFFSWHELKGEPEERLQFLTGLVHEAYLRGLPFKLQLPQWQSGMDSNVAHYNRCIYELATFKA